MAPTRADGDRIGIGHPAAARREQQAHGDVEQRCRTPSGLRPRGGRRLGRRRPGPDADGLRHSRPISGLRWSSCSTSIPVIAASSSRSWADDRTLRVSTVVEGTALEPATIYVAPPGLHLLVNPDGTLSLSKAELVHFVRPSADLLFESAAASFTDRVIAVVLTGTGEDGANGVRAVKTMGGTVLAQDEATSAYFGMPRAAIETGCVDFVLPLDEIAECLDHPDPDHGPAMSERPDDPELESLLEFLRSARVARLHRLQAAEPDPHGSASGCRRSGSSEFGDYRDLLEVDPTELAHLVRHHPDQRHRLLP